MTARLRSICASHFGRNVNGRHVENRCGQCPLRTPCLAWGSKQPRSIEELREHRETFEREAAEVIG